MPLAGRASYLTLWSMTRREQKGLGRCRLWDELLGAPGEDWLELLFPPPRFTRGPVAPMELEARAGSLPGHRVVLTRGV